MPYLLRLHAAGHLAASGGEPGGFLAFHRASMSPLLLALLLAPVECSWAAVGGAHRPAVRLAARASRRSAAPSIVMQEEGVDWKKLADQAAKQGQKLYGEAEKQFKAVDWEGLAAKASAAAKKAAEQAKAALDPPEEEQEPLPPMTSTPPATTLSPETLQQAAAAASEPGVVDESVAVATPPAPAPAPVPAPAPAPAAGSDPLDIVRIVAYVSVPALVLGAQLFFTFSRDAFTGEAVGPADMTSEYAPWEKRL